MTINAVLGFDSKGELVILLILYLKDIHFQKYICMNTWIVQLEEFVKKLLTGSSELRR